jgi:DNA-binding MarR family transcriptional regulator
MKADPGYALVNQVLGTASFLIRESHRLFRPHGLSEAQFNLLNVLGASPGGCSQRELSEALVVDRSNVTGMLDRMERRGWVRRGAHAGDRRIRVVTLTPAGRRLWEQVLPEYLAAVREVTGGLSPAEMRRLTAQLHRVEAAARALGGRAAG